MDSQAIPLIQAGGFDAASRDAVPQDSPHAGHHRRGLGMFVGHFVEMTIAMMVGMMVFGMPLAALQGLLFGASSLQIPEVKALGMAIAMTVPMVAWMRYRGHSPQASFEMGAAMIVPTLALLPLLWSGLITASALTGLEHGTMLPAMLVAMLYRRHEYGL